MPRCKIPVHIIGKGEGASPPSASLELYLPREEEIMVRQERVEKHGNLTIYVEDMTTYAEEILEVDQGY